jgi:hypothetical protein
MDSSKKTFSQWMRLLHRDIGFLAIGILVIYSLSGILLIFRDTSFLKSEKTIERQLPPGLSSNDLGMALHVRDVKIIGTKDDVVSFEGGTYNATTGKAIYTDTSLPGFLEELNELHKTSTHEIRSWISVVFAISLLFLGLSSFWMFKPSTRLFRRGLILSGIGILITVVILVI